MAEHSGVFPGWSNGEGENDEQEAITQMNNALDLEKKASGCHVSGVRMGSNSSKSKYDRIVSKDQTMTDMITHLKETGSSATMERFRKLDDDKIDLTRDLNWQIQLMSLALLDKVKEGFSGTSGVAKEFVTEMSKLAVDFFMDARGYEA